MQRILDPTQIEGFAQRSIPRIRLPDRATVFTARAERLRQLSAPGGIGHCIADYLLLMATLADAQHTALEALSSDTSDAMGAHADRPPNAEVIAQAHAHHMPLALASAGPRDKRWLRVLGQLCDSIGAQRALPATVRELCERVRQAPGMTLEAQANALLSLRYDEIDTAIAPFVMAALQVSWVGLAGALPPHDVAELDVPSVCPVCGTPPVVSIVRADNRSQGLRYLHCALCATEWHLVRVKCSQCLGTKDIAYHSIEGASEALRAESCDTCRTYRKILYQEKDTGVEPVADDLASVALDLLLSEAGYHRGSGNPLLWQHPEA